MSFSSNHFSILVTVWGCLLLSPCLLAQTLDNPFTKVETTPKVRTTFSSPIKPGSLKELPDLSTETILFLKLDSVELPRKRPKKEMSRLTYIQSKNHNKEVPKVNKKLRRAARKYPYSYKIVSLTQGNYRLHNARYILYINSFDAFTEGKKYPTGRYHTAGGPVKIVPKTLLGIIDLKTGDTYLIKELNVFNAYRPERLLWLLYQKMNAQFGLSI